jgi:hypothetical protein
MTTTLTIATGVRTSALVSKPNLGIGERLASELALAVFLLPWGLAARRRKAVGKYIHSILAFTLFATSVAVISSCGSSSHSTPTGNSTVTITATAGATTQTSSLQLTVN